jgi:post-segregation antitoxin (ccd killing protein)
MGSPYAKVSLTLPSPLLERIRARVGARGVSRYVAQAVEAEERREALRVWLADQNADHGPVSAETLEEVRREWLGAARGAS